MEILTHAMLSSNFYSPSLLCFHEWYPRNSVFRAKNLHFILNSSLLHIECLSNSYCTFSFRSQSASYQFTSLHPAGQVTISCLDLAIASHWSPSCTPASFWPVFSSSHFYLCILNRIHTHLHDFHGATWSNLCLLLQHPILLPHTLYFSHANFPSCLWTR